MPTELYVKDFSFLGSPYANVIFPSSLEASLTCTGTVFR
jgi:hypothetical protein